MKVPVDSIGHSRGLSHHILIARLCFRGIFIPPIGKFAWAKVIVQNRRRFQVDPQGLGEDCMALRLPRCGEPVSELPN